MPSLILSLLFGPAGYAHAGYKRSALVSAGVGACVVLLAAYLPYVQIFAEVNWGAESARELFDTAVLATRVWLAEAPRWAPAVVGTLVLVNVICAIDLAIFAPKRRARCGS